MCFKTFKEKIISFALISSMIFTGCTIEFDTSDLYNDAESGSDDYDSLKVHFIDVGQGDSSLIVCDGVTMLIDAGEAEESGKVISYLSDLGINQLDYVIATHPHSDHIGGLADVIESVGADTVIAPAMADESIPTTKTYKNFLEAVYTSGCEYEEAYVGEVINIGSAEFSIIAPSGDYYEDLNNYSIVGNLEYEGVNILFMGDAEKLSEDEMIDAGLAKDIDILKVGHHGSSTSSKAKFLEIIKPEYAVVSCGVDNSYNHPNEKTMQRLMGYAENIYRTDQQGTVVFTCKGSEISVECEK